MTNVVDTCHAAMLDKQHEKRWWLERKQYYQFRNQEAKNVIMPKKQGVI